MGSSAFEASFRGHLKREWFLEAARFPHTEAMPTAIHIEPTIIAGRLKFSHNPKQMKKPAKGGMRFQSFFSFARTK